MSVDSGCLGGPELLGSNAIRAENPVLVVGDDHGVVHRIEDERFVTN